MKLFEEMSPTEWASALELTVKKFVYRIVKYRDKGFRRHAAQQQGAAGGASEHAADQQQKFRHALQITQLSQGLAPPTAADLPHVVSS